MSVPKYEVGEKFQSNMFIHEILAVSVTVRGKVKYWVDGDGDRDPSTVLESQVDSWEKVEPFFETGKRYVFSGFTFDVYKIVDVLEIDGRKYAWAEFRPDDKFDNMTTLNKYNFMQMTEV